MKQRLGIAQALLNRPKLLICDEPTSALDPAGRKEILDILLAAKEQTTILFSTHILSDVERICTEVAFLNDGKIAMQGTIAELRNKQSSNGFIIEIEKKEVADMLAEAFNENHSQKPEGSRFNKATGTLVASNTFVNLALSFVDGDGYIKGKVYKCSHVENDHVRIIGENGKEIQININDPDFSFKINPRKVEK